MIHLSHPTHNWSNKKRLKCVDICFRILRNACDVTIIHIEKNDLLFMIVCYILTCYLTVPRENSITGKTSDLTKNSKPGDLAKHVKSKLNKLRRKPLASKGPQVRHLLYISNIDTHYYFNLFVLGAELLGKSPCILLFQRPLKCLTYKWFHPLKFAKSWLRFPWKKNF